MDMLLLGETIVGEEQGPTYYGFWMPAGGNEGVAGCEAFLCSGAVFEVSLETKSSDEDDGAAVSIGSASISTGAARYSFAVDEAKDLVRYVVTSNGSAFLHLQFAQPLWQPN